MSNQISIAAVVVTYNRQKLLSECLQALLSQIRRLDEIIVVDNASTDSTLAMLAADFPQISLLALSENTGGAGGFARGLQLAQQKGHKWIWLMDDDLIPQPDALAQLTQIIDEIIPPFRLFLGGLPQDRSGRLVWEPKLRNQWVTRAADLLPQSFFEVNSLAFLGLLIPATAISEIGLPRTDLFIYLDDVEYCYRARRNGYKIFCVPQSILYHPLPQRRTLNILGKIVFVEYFPAWKAYYDTRNRILVNKEYEGLRFWYHFLPVIILRMILSLVWYKEERLKKTHYYLLGLWHGLNHRTGRQVLPF